MALETYTDEQLAAMEEAALNALAARLEDERLAVRTEATALASVRDKQAVVSEWRAGVQRLSEGDHPDKARELEAAQGMLLRARARLATAQAALTRIRPVEEAQAEHDAIKALLRRVNFERQTKARAREQAAINPDQSGDVTVALPALGE